MLSRIYAPALSSLDEELIEIECDLSSGLPGFVMVGLADKAVDEARERVRSAVKNSKLMLPQKRITLNLAPADIPKDGTGYDLGMAVAVLCASGQIEAEATRDCLFLGELALDGTLRPVKGAILAAEAARRREFRCVYLPAGNAEEAALIPNIKIMPVRCLAELYYHLTGIHPLSAAPATRLDASEEPAAAEVDLKDVYGQSYAKRALEIAAAGGHNILFSGPPGSGKTLLSKALSGVIPPPTYEEMLETTKIHSLTGANNHKIITARPFRAPHHTASSVSLIGGGSVPRPGEISLSHNGILFLDEVPEFPRQVLEVLRQPLEDGHITISRASRSTRFPANFMLVATRNPCPCGFAGSDTGRCDCTTYTIAQYAKRLSGPLLDRIDLIIEVQPVDRADITERRDAEPSAAVAARVKSARKIQAKRFESRPGCLNNNMGTDDLKTYCALDADTKAVARHAIAALGLTARSYTKAIKVARTIADLDCSETILFAHFSEALQYRGRK
jgi:magnesium chelatase family protein